MQLYLCIVEELILVEIFFSNAVKVTTISSMQSLEYSCNKYCDLIGHSEVSISHRDLKAFIEIDLQVLIETYKLS